MAPLNDLRFLQIKIPANQNLNLSYASVCKFAISIINMLAELFYSHHKIYGPRREGAVFSFKLCKN